MVLLGNWGAVLLGVVGGVAALPVEVELGKRGVFLSPVCGLYLLAVFLGVIYHLSSVFYLLSFVLKTIMLKIN